MGKTSSQITPDSKARDPQLYGKMTSSHRSKARTVYRLTPDDIQEIISDAHLTQRGFAETFGLAQITVESWLGGKRHPTDAGNVLLMVIAEHPEIVRAVVDCWRAAESDTAQGQSHSAHSITDRIPLTDLKTLRKHLDLTQQEFSDRFAIPKCNIADWEQCRDGKEPEGTARLLLAVINLYPSTVREVVDLYRYHYRSAPQQTAFGECSRKA